MTNENVVAATRAFVVESFLYARPDYDFGVDDSLLDRGIVDSLGVIELVDFVHTTFGIDVGDDEITEENFGRLSAIARFVLAKQQAGHGLATRDGFDLTVVATDPDVPPS